MPIFDERDYDNALQADVTPNGMVDLSYYLTVERKLIDALSISIVEPLSSPWLYCPLEELPSALGVDDPLEEGDDVHSALVLGGVAVILTLLNLVHEDSVPGLLAHLASFCDQIDAAQRDDVSIIEHRYLLAQLVEFCEPTDPIACQLAVMRILDSCHDDEGEVLLEAALATTKYLLSVALTVLCCDDDDCTVEMIESLKTCHAERAAEPVVPYFNELDEQEDEE